MSIAHERKRCPKCGHSNRASAKVCTECGFAFFLEDTSGMLRKRCSHCGFMNRMGAKVCSQCGSKFHSKLLTTRAKSRNRAQKWCPQCGAERHEGAKVCSFCGYHFKEVPAPKPQPKQVEPPFEAPITQSNSLSDAAIHTFASAPEAKVPLQPSEPPFEPPITQSSTNAEPITVHNVTSAPPEPKAPDLSGEPAPYISKDELERLRRMGGERPGVFLRLFQAMRDDKP
jgi:DNA-directed RNA polymerase subunit RPC12/RpoP